ncbi:ferritin [Desulfoplanes formicivorans]|uniref:Ferritin n=1 Tax=Desulfoplanes formicivorans TaxID=1592317 RepID=A0A194AJT1_9BACT|nr:ferritin [Desulfoplanes formicivorans]GAU09500.1 ferritin [Desulfoplanes formicivorans]
MLSKKLEKAFNDQVNAEMYSSYLYLSMAAFFQNQNLPGFAGWMKAQAQEELFHAMKFYDYIMERGGQVVLAPIAGPPTEWESPRAVMEATLEHEQKVTGLINNLVNLAMEEKDHASTIFLQWFVSEQVEEEDSVGDVLNKIKLMGDSGSGLFMLDRDMGQRVFTPPQTEA